jgi:hypothetical protein
VTLRGSLAAGIFAACMALPHGVAQQADTAHGRPRAAHPWAPGERFEYNVKLGIFNVGRASLEVLGIDTLRGVPCYHVAFTIRGRALVYRLTDTLESWFSVADLVSRRFVQNGNENGRLYSRNYVIDAARGLWVRNGVDSGVTVAEPLDEASFFYFARTLPMENGARYDFSRYFIYDRNPVTIRVLGRQAITVPAGRFNAIVVRPIFKSRGIFAEGGEATVWFSDDASRIPIRIQSRMSVGTLDLLLRAR